MPFETILPIPELYSARRVLCIQPHYDDNDIGAGGTLAQLARRGAELFYLTATDDLMGVVDLELTNEKAAQALKRDQYAAGEIIGVKEQLWCAYPDAGEYSYFDLRRDFLKYIRLLQPDFIFAPDPWLTYEAHRDHIQTGLAAAEAAILAGVKKIPSSDSQVDGAYPGHELQGVAFYYTREPNIVIDLAASWEEKLAAVRCYQAQFDPPGMEKLLLALEVKARQCAGGQPFERGEPLKVLHPSALHCGI
jgi:LmbE family N-acetylglucosaminyl deacetylase